ncbi:exonuclease domain-containing protein [Comamonas thiooxydans]|uniref:exonuclease domain-containing protein n=1 Tax=Comamonas thiooxydans TaxID=363952 RepID=UPI000B40C9A8|nr:exonuclease domain-containing protein [Comamonas thiooxydans]
MTRFATIDVETANPRLSSICQIGLVIYENHQVVDSWSSLINPNADFRDFNIRIHGIRPQDVTHAPTFDKVFYELQKMIGSSMVSSYGAFDRSAFSQACATHELPELSKTWVDLQQVVRNAWPTDFTANGWSLKQICKQLEIPLHNHHDALSDATAAAEVFVRAQQATDTFAHHWLDQSRYRLSTIGQSNPRASNSVKEIAINENGPLFGEVVVFTGELSMPRVVAATRAAAIGCLPANGVTKKTTILVVGEQDLTIVRSDGKSTKQIKAEELIAKGQEIRILGEDSFDALLKQHGL